MAKTVCLQCGNVGISTDLVYCANCDEYAIHLYCMDVKPMPDTKPESVHWTCCNDESRFSNKEERVIGAKSGTNQKSEIKRNKFVYSFIDQEPDLSVEPLIRSIWTGSFDLGFEKSDCRRIGDFSAYLSNKGSQKACNEAIRFPPDLQFEMVQKSLVWPESDPTADNVAFYFFPFLQNKKVSDSLVFELVRGDLAMRAFVQNTELLVFSSTDLPPRCRRFQGALYLWGMLRGKQNNTADFE